MENLEQKTQEINAKIGRNLTKARIEAGISRNILAKALSISHQQVFKYEMGTDQISIAKLYLVSKFLKKDINSFLEGIGDYQPDNLERENYTLYTNLMHNFKKIKDKSCKYAVNDLVRKMANVNEN